jgi:hypothetical protein
LKVVKEDHVGIVLGDLCDGLEYLDVPMHDCRGGSSRRCSVSCPPCSCSQSCHRCSVSCPPCSCSQSCRP